MSKNVRNAGDHKRDAEIPERSQRHFQAEGAMGDAEVRAADPWWPFKCSLVDNRWYVNKAKIRRSIGRREDYDEALM